MQTIDFNKISELRELDDDGSDSVLKELVSLFLQSTPPKLKKIIECYYLKDFSTVRKEAHSLRSSSLSLGAEVLSQLAHDLEYAKEGPELETQMGEAIKKLNPEFLSLKAELEKLVA